jgi:hypothetical protein
MSGLPKQVTWWASLSGRDLSDPRVCEELDKPPLLFSSYAEREREREREIEIEIYIERDRWIYIERDRWREREI